MSDRFVKKMPDSVGGRARSGVRKFAMVESMILALGIGVLVAGPGCATVSPGTLGEKGHTETGEASWYSVKTNGGTTTASGEKLTNSGKVAAHRTLPFGTKVRVTNLKNNKSEVVRIIDRGPFIRGRIIDVSIGVAEELGFVSQGITPCRIEVISVP